MSKIHFIFTKQITPRDCNFNEGKPFKEVTFSDVEYSEESYGVKVKFKDGSSYTYPWHSLDRFKVYGQED